MKTCKNTLDLEGKIRDYERRLLASEMSQAEALPDQSQALATAQLSHLTFESEMPGHVIGQNLSRLHDYMVRAQQLITMLQAQGKSTPAVKEAMRRVDWDFVKEQYPRTVRESLEVLRKLQTEIHRPKEEKHHV